MLNKIITQKQRRKNRIRSKISWSAERPRLSVYRSLRLIKLQLVDDDTWRTLYAVSGPRNEAWAKALWAKLAKECWIKDIVLDRNGAQYHWLIKFLADEARKWGLNF